MAADEAILEAHLAGEVPPTLRLYGWNPAAVSIGYSQKISEAEIRSITDHGFDVVRRTTGGRAVLHSGDLTYSFVGSSAMENEKIKDQHLLSTSVAGAYKEICQGLIIAIEQFGITLELGSSKSDYRVNYDCFRATTNADLQYAGKKMIGSAQLRRKNAVLQHGSILLNQDQKKMTEIYGGTYEGAEDRHANLFEVIGKSVSMHDLEAAIKLGFSEAFAVAVEPSQLTTDERKRIEVLIPKYKVIS